MCEDRCEVLAVKNYSVIPLFSRIWVGLQSGWTRLKSNRPMQLSLYSWWNQIWQVHRLSRSTTSALWGFCWLLNHMHVNHLKLTHNIQRWWKRVGKVGVCPPRFCQNRRRCLAAAACCITSCPLRFLDLAPSLYNK